ncbi:hypothetical protein [Streptomyces coerulescens]|uniref:Uncharacterized protein n=1 Tax=Streptomyces coerulescens TaxID=29304 RepID=A0ABW0CXD5_STRCD
MTTAESGHLKRVDELRGHPLDDAPLSKAMIESVNARLRDVRRTGEPSYLFITDRLRAEEEAHPWAVRFWPVRDDDGDLCAIAYWGVDVTAEYEARHRLLLLSEANSAIGRTLDVEHTAQELAEAFVPVFADHAEVDLFAGVLGGQEPPLVPASGAIRLRSAAHAPSGQPDRRAPPPRPPTSRPLLPAPLWRPALPPRRPRSAWPTTRAHATDTPQDRKWPRNGRTGRPACPW